MSESTVPVSAKIHQRIKFAVRGTGGNAMELDTDIFYNISVGA